jgi:hypothetical protein
MILPSLSDVLAANGAAGVNFTKAMDPQASDVYVNQILTNISINWFADPKEQYLHTQLFPMVPVQLQSGIIEVWSQSDLMRNQSAARAPGAYPAQIGVGVDLTNTYKCGAHAVEAIGTREERANYTLAASYDYTKMQLLSRAVNLKRELDFADVAFGASSWGTNVTVAAGDKWDVPSTDIIAQIDDAMNAVQLAGGYRPNTWSMNRKVWTAVKRNPGIIARISNVVAGNGAAASGNPRLVTRESVAALFELDMVLVEDKVYNSANKGATDAMSFVIGNHSLLAYVTKTPSLTEPSAGYGFAWAGATGNAQGILARNGPDIRGGFDFYQLHHYEQFKVVVPNLGYQFRDCLSA